MTNTLENLTQAVEQWRGERGNHPIAPREKNPYGAKIFALNKEWSAIKKAHAAELEAKRKNYREQVVKFQELSNLWEKDNRGPRPDSAKRGPARQEHSDEVKKAAAAAIREGHKKTTVRVILGVSNTARLNEILDQGEALLKAEEEGW
jgi:hypothetical protein